MNKARSDIYDLIVLDIMLPGLDGLSLCRMLRNDSKTATVPIIMLTARGTEVDKIVGLESGANDYIVKPFGLGEFLARVRVQMRQPPPEAGRKRDELTAGNLRLDLTGRRVFKDEAEIKLTYKEFSLLAVFMRNKSAVLSRDFLIANVWGENYLIGESDKRTVDVHIRWLREKLRTIHPGRCASARCAASATGSRAKVDTLLFGMLLALLVAGIGLAIQSRRLRAAQAAIVGQRIQAGQLRARLEQSQRQRLERDGLLAAADAIAFDMIILLDSDKRVLSLNQSAQRLAAEESAVGKPLAQMIDSPELLALVNLAQAEDEGLDEQIVIGACTYRARAQSLDAAGQAGYVGIALRDITDLVQLNRARRDLVANISHELRTPITRIRLIIEGLFLDADKPKRKASIQSLKEIAMETDSLLWLAQELLDLSMIESGEAILRLVKTPLKPIIDDSIQRLQSQAEIKSLKIVSHVPRELAALCDADQLKRVLANLLHNAIKWSPPNEAISVTAAENDEEIVVAVFDNGPGVPEDLRERIFERFYQADVSRSGDEGTGLGLAICKHIVEAHGGRIWAAGKSQVLGGQFVFTVLKADADFQRGASDTPYRAPKEPASEVAAPV